MPDLFKDLLWDGLIKAAIARLLVAVPFLSWGPLPAIVSWIVFKFADQLYIGLKEVIDLHKIAIQNEEHLKAFERAGAVLRILADQKGIESQEFLNAREEAKNALAKFVKYNAVK